MNTKQVHPSVPALASRYWASKGNPFKDIVSFYFCDNKKDANECAELALRGEKRATASSLFYYPMDKPASAESWRQLYCNQFGWYRPLRDRN